MAVYRRLFIETKKEKAFLALGIIQDPSIQLNGHHSPLLQQIINKNQKPNKDLQNSSIGTGYLLVLFLKTHQE